MEEENKILLETYHHLEDIIIAYRKLSVFNYQVEYNQDVCGKMLDAAEDYNRKALEITAIIIQVDTRRIWKPRRLQLKGTSMIKKLQMAPLIEEIFQEQEKIETLLQKRGVTVDPHLQPSGWFERQIVLGGSAGRIKLMLLFLSFFIFYNAIVLWFVVNNFG